MLLSQQRIAPWIIWVLAALASLVCLPRLLGTERIVQQVSTRRPYAVLTGITPLPDEPVKQEVSTSDELKMLVPPVGKADQLSAADEAVVNQEAEVDPQAETPTPSIRFSGVAFEGTPDRPAFPKIVPAPAALGDPNIEEALPGQPPGGQFESAESKPDLPHTTLKFAPLEEEPAPKVAVPPTVELQAPIAAPNLAVKYWIVSTRCCRQSYHKCGLSCRFTCHAVTQDCQYVPVCLEQLIAGQIPGAPTCVLAHGSFTRMEDVWQDSECTYCWLRGACPQVPLNFIYFTWPSEGPFALVPNNPLSTAIPCLDFGVLGSRAELNGFYLADLIGSLPGPTTVSLIGHSLGARTVASSLHLLGGGTVHGQTRGNLADCGHRIRVVLAAAAIEHDWLNPDDRYGCALNRVECLLNLSNECDYALALYPLRKPFSSRALARTGFTSKDQRKLGDRLVHVSELDVAPVIGKGHSWPNYCRQPGIAAAVSPYVYFEAAQGVVQSTKVPR